jgi:catechol 2,3-dioxygenase-like lactoylglutathione lyase family enzyme
MVGIGNVVMNVKDAQRAADFWSRALGYRRTGKEGLVLVPPDGTEPRVVMDETDRAHLDLYTQNAQEQQAEIERLISLGARRVPDWEYPPGAGFAVLEDTEGNVFCVLNAGS